jgi:hypothetical protein
MAILCFHQSRRMEGGNRKLLGGVDVSVSISMRWLCVARWLCGVTRCQPCVAGVCRRPTPHTLPPLACPPLAPQVSKTVAAAAPTTSTGKGPLVSITSSTVAAKAPAAPKPIFVANSNGKGLAPSTWTYGNPAVIKVSAAAAAAAAPVDRRGPTPSWLVPSPSKAHSRATPTT